MSQPILFPKAETPATLCERALDQMLTHRGRPDALVGRALAIDPGFAFAHRLRMALIVRANAADARASLEASAAAIEAAAAALGPNARRHASAARAWAEGEAALALERYGAIVVDDPRDVVALCVAHALDFRLGRLRMLRDRIAQVLPEWSADAAGYPSVLAMFAFGLEENGQYRQAEKAARQALSLDPRHPGAIHVLAHVMEMQGRARAGLALLDRTEPAWAHGTGFSVHLAWHKALFLLDVNEPLAALAVYDSQVTIGRTLDLNALSDAAALLWRLKLRDVDVGRRWRTLADRWAAAPLAGARSFHVLHAFIAAAAAGRVAAAHRAFALLPGLGRAEATEALPEDALAPPLCEALLAYAEGDYPACAERLVRLRDLSHRCGGSVAQCDLVQLTFIEAAFRGEKPRLARALIAERAAQRPESPLNGVLQRRLRTLLSTEARGRSTGERLSCAG